MDDSPLSDSLPFETIIQLLMTLLSGYDPRSSSLAESIKVVASRKLAQDGPLLLEGSFNEELVDRDPEELLLGDESTDASVVNDLDPSDLNSPKSYRPADLAALPWPADSEVRYPGICKYTGNGSVPKLNTERVWRSAKRRPPFAVTVVTQLSIDRLAALELQCSVWGSVIAAAVHVPLVDGLVQSSLKEIDGKEKDAPLALLNAFHSRMETDGLCLLDLVYISEQLPSQKYVGLYPVNGLRNRAMQLALTDILILLDADFIPNKQLSDDLKDKELYETLLRVTESQQAIVLPAFEVLLEGEEGRNAALRAIESKDNVRRMLGNRRLQGFHMDGFVSGHRSTDFDRWLGATVSYRAGYEEVRCTA